ncbi:MAG: hypothetical protein ACLP9K_08845 [Nitrososphaerales archaeon]
MSGYLNRAYRKSRSRASPLPEDASLFNEAIGLPIHPVTNLPSPLLQYQIDILGYQGKDLIIVKSNKIGITETILRDMVYRGAAGDCRGYLLMLGAQDERLAKENMWRLQSIFLRSRVLAPMIFGRPTATRLQLTNGTVYRVMPRRAAAMRGWARMKYAFLDEAAHYGLLEDEEFLSATTSRLSNTDGYLRLASTPHGMRGFFYRMCRAGDSGETQMKVLTLTYHVALGKLIGQEFIDKERTRLGPRFGQEYECKFIGSGTAAIEPELLERMTGDYELEPL